LALVLNVALTLAGLPGDTTDTAALVVGSVSVNVKVAVRGVVGVLEGPPAAPPPPHADNMTAASGAASRNNPRFVHSRTLLAQLALPV